MKICSSKNEEVEKFNVYKTLDQFGPFMLAKFYDPLPLEEALSVYFDKNLTKHDYGFGKSSH